MVLYDSHVHTSFSTDSDTPMEHMVRQGIKNQLKGITLTDHMDYCFPAKYNWEPKDSAPFTFDFDAYVTQVSQLKEQYSGQIELYCGVEAGLKEDAWQKNVILGQNPALDYMIGSIHLVRDIDPYVSEYWESFGEEKGLLLYFETTLKNLEQLGELRIDALGHLDYIVRYCPSGHRVNAYSMFSDLIDAILEHVIKKEISLEINTAGYKNGGTMPNPNEDIIRRYRDMGGTLITFGSDAHTPERLSAHFQDAERLVRNAGFDSYVTYVKRRPVFHSF